MCVREMCVHACVFVCGCVLHNPHQQPRCVDIDVFKHSELFLDSDRQQPWSVELCSHPVPHTAMLPFKRRGQGPERGNWFIELDFFTGLSLDMIPYLGFGFYVMAYRFVCVCVHLLRTSVVAGS